MNIGIETAAAQFLSWEYLFRIFDIVSLLCVVRNKLGKGRPFFCRLTFGSNLSLSYHRTSLTSLFSLLYMCWKYIACLGARQWWKEGGGGEEQNKRPHVAKNAWVSSDILPLRWITSSPHSHGRKVAREVEGDEAAVMWEPVYQISSRDSFTVLTARHNRGYRYTSPHRLSTDPLVCTWTVRKEEMRRRRGRRERKKGEERDGGEEGKEGEEKKERGRGTEGRERGEGGGRRERRGRRFGRGRRGRRVRKWRKGRRGRRWRKGRRWSREMKERRGKRKEGWKEGKEGKEEGAEGGEGGERRGRRWRKERRGKKRRRVWKGMKGSRGRTI